MSLNGLDDPKVAEAFEAAAAEPGGWFLLKYASRDEVELLGKGAGGITEVRAAVTSYEDTSPLYGFLRYRRRSVVIKYLPEGCSRLVQARVAVHFNAVCERLTPHDTTFEMAAATDLTNRKLSAACSLHAASGSNSSASSGSRRRRLNEIAEEDEDEQRAAKRQSLHDDAAAGDAEAAAPPVKLDADLASSPEQTKFAAPSTTVVPSFVGAADEWPASPGPSVDSGRRMSSQSSRQDVFGHSAYAYSKPKVKLGPRPSLDVGGRPQTAGNFRPVSSIPAGFKLFGKGAKKGRSKDDGASFGASALGDAIPEVPFAISSIPIPEEPSKTYFDAARPATSSGVSTKAPSVATTVGKSAMTPEKARLKKAMQMREKKKKLKNQPPVPALPVVEQTAPEIPAAQPEENEQEKIEEQTEENAEEKAAEEAATSSEKRLTIVKADSAIAISASPASTNTDEGSELTHSDSRPTSPVIASSEPDRSTKASSLSESTDETVQAKDEDVGEKPGDGLPAPLGDQAARSQTPDEEKTPTLEDSQPGRAVQTEKEATAGGDTIVVVAPAAPVVASTREDETPTPPEQATEGAFDETTDKVDDTETVEIAQPVEPEPLKVEDERPPREEPAAMEEPASKDSAPNADTKPAPAPEPDHEVARDTPRIEDAQEAMVAPVSKFSANIPTVANASRETRRSLAAAEMSKIPVTADAQPATATDQNDHARTHELPQPGVKQSVSKNDLRAAAKAAANPYVVDDPPPPLPSHSLLGEPAQDRDGSDAETASVETRPKRRTVIEPIRTDLAPPPPPHSRPESRAETNFSDDDSLLEELQSATVQEAKPMFVAKTPVTPGFPGPVFASSSSTSPRGQGSPRAHVVRTVSTPARSGVGMPTDVSQSSARTVSSSGAAYLHRVTQQHTAAGGGNLAAKKTNMGSRISQRIKALEMLSGGPAEDAAQAQAAGAPAAAAGRDRPSSTFFSVGKGRVASRSPSVLERASSFASHAPPPTASSRTQSRESSPETERQMQRDRSGSMASRVSRFEGNVPRGRPESISVTARIVRGPEQQGMAYRGSETPKDPAQYSYLELKQSPLVVAHQKASPPSTSPDKETIVERRASKESRRSMSQDHSSGRRSRRSSLTIVRDYIKDKRKSLSTSTLDTPVGPPPAKSPARPPSTHQNNSIAHRLSFSSHRSSMSRDRETPMSPSAWTEGSGSGDEGRSLSSGGGISADGKKKSRAGRLMRRLSTLGSRGKNSISGSITATVTEEDGPEPTSPPPASSTRSRPSTTATSATTAPSVVAMQHLGDVNVQFPDTLLWKRRNLAIDAQGFVVLSALQAAAAQASSAGGGRANAAAQAHTRRYHLGELRGPPYVPDVEVQELPNSVVLDLMGGGGVQIACEDRAGQLAVLHVLQDAHAGHASAFGL